MNYPRITWDQEANAASIYFREIQPGESARQLPVEDQSGEIAAVLDFSADGELLQVELMNAREQMPKNLPTDVISP